MNSVFGIYKSKVSNDGIPRDLKTNGYVSLWISNADETYSYLTEERSTFPTIPAINDVSGVDVQPGYRQIVATDSEGTVLLFTEYSEGSRIGTALSWFLFLLVLISSALL